jgi:hypothetical protein
MGGARVQAWLGRLDENLEQGNFTREEPDDLAGRTAHSPKLLKAVVGATPP